MLQVAARHALASTEAGRVVVTAPGARAEADGGGAGRRRAVRRAAAAGHRRRAARRAAGLAGADGDRTEPALLTQLARLVGLRLENAQLYEAEHRIASTLQHSLLPRSLPQVPGAMVASRYLPGSAEAEVGGDWYDVIVAPATTSCSWSSATWSARACRPPPAMGQLRNALRAYILEGFDCGEALTRLNRLVGTTWAGASSRPWSASGSTRAPGRLQYSSAGHPSPLLVAPRRRGQFLHDRALGPPIGALARRRLPDASRRELAAGQPAAALHRRADRGPAARHRRRRWPSSAPTRPSRPSTSRTCSTRCSSRAAGQTRRDDIALLALQATEPREFVLRLPADPTRLSVLRSRLEDFLAAHGVPEDDIFDLTVAVSEAAANAIEHPVDPAEPMITRRGVARRRRGAGDGAGHRPVAAEPTGSGFRGRGLALIGALARAVGATATGRRAPR